MPRLALVLLIVLTVLAAGCGGSETRIYKVSDLAALMLTPSEAPQGTRYAAQASGANALAKEEDGAAQIEQLRRFGYRGNYAAQFFGEEGPAVFAESVAIVFANGDGAADALAFLEGTLREQGEDVAAIDAAGLGDDSWGLSGRFFPGAPPTYFYSWRRANLLLTVALAGDPSTVTEKATRGLADLVDGRAR